MSSATERPSRAPSTTKSVIRAIASGWLSLTPRSSRRRATSAAMAIKSLSFSRGVRFIALASPHGFLAIQQIPWLRSRPKPRLAPAERNNGRDKRGTQSVGRGGKKTDDDQAIEGAGSTFHIRACRVERRSQIRQASLNIGRRCDDRRKGARARPDRLALKGRAGMLQARLVGEHEPPVAANAPGIPDARVDLAFAHRQAPEHQRFRDEECSLAGRLDLEPPLEPRALKQERLLRQP